MTTRRPVSGCTANCTLEPPVSTPITRSTSSEALRIIWYSLSVSVCAGATVIESPVCTPMGSRFSMEQTMMQLSFLSRTTSISYSFQPSSDSSISSSLVGERSRPRIQISSKSSGFQAMPPPVPPSVKDGRIMQGKPSCACTCLASSSECAMALRGVSRPMDCIALSNSCLSSALSIASLLAPISSTPYFSRTPSRARSSAQFKPVWPPMVGRIASGFSFAMMFSTCCQRTGSI